MDPQAVLLYVLASVSTGAGVRSVVSDRFHKISAGILALAGGLSPWIFVAQIQKNLPAAHFFWMLGLFGPGLLLLLSFFAYGKGQPTPKRGVSAGWALAGMFSGLGFTLAAINLLGKME